MRPHGVVAGYKGANLPIMARRHRVGPECRSKQYKQDPLPNFCRAIPSTIGVARRRWLMRCERGSTLARCHSLPRSNRMSDYVFSRTAAQRSDDQSLSWLCGSVALTETTDRHGTALWDAVCFRPTLTSHLWSVMFK